MSLMARGKEKSAVPPASAGGCSQKKAATRGRCGPSPNSTCGGCIVAGAASGAVPGWPGAVEMQGRCAEDALEMRWRCAGDAVEMRWRCGGDAVEQATWTVTWTTLALGLHCGNQTAAALLWSVEGRRVQARGRLEPYAAGSAAAKHA